MTSFQHEIPKASSIHLCILLAEGIPTNRNPVIKQKFSSPKGAGILLFEKSEKRFSA
jgi:hypothetical protein